MICDPERNYRRIGPPGTLLDEGDWDDYARELRDSELMTLELEQEYFTSYTFQTKLKVNRIFPSNVYNLVRGKTCAIKLRNRVWWWMYENEMEEDLTEEERRQVLGQRNATRWKPDCMKTFTVL